MSWISDPNFNFFKWIFFFFLIFISGISLALLLAGILFGIRIKNDKNIKYVKLFIDLLPSCLFASLSIFILIIANIRFNNIPIELLVLSSILITGILLSANNKTPIPFFIFFSLIILFISVKSIIYKIKNKSP